MWYFNCGLEPTTPRAIAPMATKRWTYYIWRVSDRVLPFSATWQLAPFSQSRFCLCRRNDAQPVPVSSDAEEFLTETFCALTCSSSNQTMLTPTPSSVMLADLVLIALLTQTFWTKQITKSIWHCTDAWLQSVGWSGAWGFLCIWPSLQFSNCTNPFIFDASRCFISGCHLTNSS